MQFHATENGTLFLFFQQRLNGEPETNNSPENCFEFGVGGLQQTNFFILIFVPSRNVQAKFLFVI